MVATRLGEQAREWEADLATAMREESRQVGEVQV